MLNHLPLDVFNSLKNYFLENNRDRLALVRSTGDRYWGLGGDAVASLRAGAALEKQQEVEEARLGKIRIRYRAVRDEYSRCMALGILGRGYRIVAREYGIAPLLFCRFINREH